MQQFHGVFFEESQEHLEEMEQLLMELDLEDPDYEQLNSIFRAAHSIKGGSGIFGLDALTGLTHVMENLLDLARNGAMQLNVALVDKLLATVDMLKVILNCYRNEQEIDWKSIEKEITALNQFLGNDKNTEADDGFGFFEEVSPTAEEEAFGFFETEDKEKTKSEIEDDGFGFFEAIAPSDNPNNSSATPAAPPQKTPSKKKSEQYNHKSSKKAKAPPTNDTVRATIRVDTNKVDSLVNLVGEIVITQSMLTMIGSDFESIQEDKLQNAIAELERNTREIQEAVMSIRMLPMSFVFNRFPRVVRDLSSKLGKKVELIIDGGNTEIDKGLIEKLVDPLTHLIRNSIDHGIEQPEARIASGKSEIGKVTLVASQRGGNILISIIDDGNGLNREKILEKAKEKGINISDDISNQQVWDLIFAAGFSTATVVTDVSGRGVGMDVVKRNIESIGGQIEIESTPGQGSSFNIRLPLTLAIVDGMCVSVGDQVYVVPLINIIESIQPEFEQIKYLTNERLLWVRDQYWPILNLHQLMEISNANDDPTSAILILIESSKKRFALLVDALVGQQQVVIKNLEHHYRRIAGVAGATIMGDGSVALILDVESLSNQITTNIQEIEANHEYSNV